MLVQNLLQPFQVEYIRAHECPIKPHHHTFFELVYMLSGEGIYTINQNRFDYQAESLFLLMPGDVHYTEVKSTTHFLFIRFNTIYLEGQKTSAPHASLGEWVRKLEYVFLNRNQLQGSVVANASDKPLVKALAEAIMQEHLHGQPLHRELSQQLINTLITVVARNISLRLADKTRVDPQASPDILTYIHRHIYQAELLKVETIAAHFHISPHYLGEYFKKHTGLSLLQYIIGYKLSLVEIRLRHSDMRLNEIAYELGFTDESHLTKTFKKYRGMTPAEYRKNRLAINP
jgi:AraC-like DNA-binding protein